MTFGDPFEDSGVECAPLVWAQVRNHVDSLAVNAHLLLQSTNCHVAPRGSNPNRFFVEQNADGWVMDGWQFFSLSSLRPTVNAPPPHLAFSLSVK